MKKTLELFAIAFAIIVCGCGQSQVAIGPDLGDGAEVAASSPYVVDSEPTGAVPVGEARANVQDDELVTLVGLIGGSSEPFVDDLAAFTIVDASVPYCAPDEGCPTPWDYCCETDAVRDNIATIRIVDDAGTLVAKDARELLNVKELSTVVVQGKAKRDEQGNLTVAATKVFVRPTN